MLGDGVCRVQKGCKSEGEQYADQHEQNRPKVHWGTVMSRVWKRWVMEEHHDLLFPNSPKWKRKSGTPRQNRMNGKKRKSRGSQNRVCTHSHVYLYNIPAHQSDLPPLHPQQTCLKLFMTKNRGKVFISFLSTVASNMIRPQMKAYW